MKPQIKNELVDLGLPSGTKWMKYNLDAEHGNTPESWYGKYFQWSATTGSIVETNSDDQIISKKKFDWGDYDGMAERVITGLVRDSNKDEEGYFAYSNNEETLYFDEEEVGYTTWAFEKTSKGEFAFIGGVALDTADDTYRVNGLLNPSSIDTAHDAITAAFGASYHMPTVAQFQELIDHTNHFIVNNYNGITGLKGELFTSKVKGNNEELFIPFSGCCSCGSRYFVGYNFYIWSSEIYPDDTYYAQNLYINYNGYVYVNHCGRCSGAAVRGVQDAQ